MKTLSEKTFDIGNGLAIECRSERTRSGFRHLAVARINGSEAAKAKVCYCNRTWERFEFESVIERVAGRLPKEQGAAVLAFCKTYCEPNRLAPVAAVMGLLGPVRAPAGHLPAAHPRPRSHRALCPPPGSARLP